MMTTMLPPRVGLCLGERILPTVPVRVRGDEVSLVVPHLPPCPEGVRLRLDWQDGSTTELGGRLRMVDEEGHLAYVEVQSVRGDWRPFLAYLGGHAVYAPGPAPPPA